ncbi:MAG: hypothetical protein IIA49_09175 [Bacteroidetes bacterium]|nr:hypothetical protein [Bacteroidota bacterium]
MPHFTDRNYTGSFSGVGPFSLIGDDCTFSVTANGTVTFTLTHNANNSITGSANVTSGTFQSTPTGGTFCDPSSGSFGGSGSVSGTFPNIIVTASDFISTTFNGSFIDPSSTITGTAVSTFTNTTGQITSNFTANAVITRLPPVISIDISTSVLEGDDVKVTLTRSFATNEVSSVTISTSATLSATASPKGTPDADRTAADFWEKQTKLQFLVHFSDSTPSYFYF